MHKTPNTSVNSSKTLQNPQYKVGEKVKASYWASVHKKRKVSRKISSKPCKWGDVARDIQTCGCSEGQGCISVTCGCLCRRRVVPVMDAFFPSPFLPLFFLFLFYSFILFFCLRTNQGTLPWHGDQSWQRYPQVLSQRWEGWLVMRPPFPWPCNQESLPWRGNQLVAMSYC
jgi:hypothetical protein